MILNTSQKATQPTCRVEFSSLAASELSKTCLRALSTSKVIAYGTKKRNEIRFNPNITMLPVTYMWKPLTGDVAIYPPVNASMTPNSKR